MNISTSISAIQSDQMLMNSSAHNVANVKTEGFIPSSGRTVSGAGESIRTDVSKATDTRSPKSQTDLAKELTEQMTVEASVDVNAAAIRTQDEALGSLLDIKA